MGRWSLDKHSAGHLARWMAMIHSLLTTKTLTELVSDVGATKSSIHPTEIAQGNKQTRQRSIKHVKE